MESTAESERRCRFCGHTFDVPRKDVEFCSDRCRKLYERVQAPEAVLRVSGVPKRFLGSSLANFEGDRRLFAPLTDFPEHMTMVFFSGNIGAGKTHCAVGLLREAMLRDPREGHFVTSTDLFLELRATMSATSETEHQVMSNYTRNTLLVLDDLGAEKLSEYVRQSWYHVIETRYSEMRPTIVTSNLSLDEVAEAYGDRIASRLGSGFVMNFAGPDHRLILRQKGERR